MNIFNNLYTNFFSVGSLIPVCFALFSAYIFLITVSEKSKSTFHLGIAFLYISFFNFAYFIAASLYHPNAVYHRWFTASIILFSESHMIMFIFYLFEEKHLIFARVLLAVQYFIESIVTGFFIYFPKDAKKVYHFDGHYWDFDADLVSKIVGIFIFINIIIFIVTMIWKALKSERNVRWKIILLGNTYLIIAIIPSIINFLSRDGYLDRGIYQVSWDLLSILGFFLLSIVYINTTRDKTTIMTKIIATSLITLLIVFQGLTYFYFQDKERAYDIIHKSNLDHSLDSDFRSPDTRYIVSYSLHDNKFNNYYVYKSDPDNFDFTSYKNGFINTAILEKIKNISKNNSKEDIIRLLNQSSNYFDGYKSIILNDLNSKKIDPPQKIIATILDLKPLIRYNYNIIIKLPDKNVNKELINFLSIEQGRLKSFNKAVLNNIKHTSLKGKELKEEVLKYFADIELAGSRYYKTYNNNHYVAYRKVDFDNNLVYEIGYSYLAYRRYLNSSGIRLIIILGMIILVVIIGFRFFFLGSLINPVKTLQHGLDQIREGNLDVHIPVKIMDEIGLLTHNFNIMANAISNTKRRLDEYMNNLESKVDKRTKELQNSLEEIQNYKSQQDGDYFLTSLLLEPFSKNKASGVNVAIDFLIKEKKEFKFRKWEKEIGGDICMSHNLLLKGKLYSVFLNADAMGKSIQGAGGALVLGSSFQSIIDGTRFSSIEQEQYPEYWLKNTYIELQRLFESFEGSMLISLVIGLIEDETGIIYYLNIEHPWTVLYRDDKASFIENELLLRKLGVPFSKTSICIKVFRLQAGDIIIIGSDGRDDILLKYNERKVNEDENLFLRFVERGNANLEKMYNEILQEGELTDDLSFLRISYKENQKEERKEETVISTLLQRVKNLVKDNEIDNAIALLDDALLTYKNNSNMLKELLKLQVNKKEYKKALVNIEKYVDLVPEDTEILYVASYCYMKIGELKKAGEVGERAYLRDPTRLKYILHLAKIYITLKNYTEADMLIDEVLTIDPDNRKALDLKNSL